MDSANEIDDIERLLNVLGVPGLPYQSFRQSISAQQLEPAGRAGTRAASTRIETSFPLLAAALPALADALIPPASDIKQPQHVAELPLKDAGGDTVPPYEHAAATNTAPTVMPAPFSATPPAPKPSVFHKLANASPVSMTQAPARPAETPIRGVFSVLRGVPVQRETETTGQRGIRTLFCRP